MRDLTTLVFVLSSSVTVPSTVPASLSLRMKSPAAFFERFVKLRIGLSER